MKRLEMFLMVLHVPVDYVMLLLAAVSAYMLRFSDWAIGLKPVVFDLPIEEYVGIASLVALLWVGVFALAGLYRPDVNRKLAGDLSRVLFAATAALAIVALYIMFTQQLFDSRFLVASGWMFAVVYVSLGRLLLRGLKGWFYRMGIGLRRVVVIGSGRVTDAIVDMFRARPALGYAVLDVYPKFDKDTMATIQAERPDELLYTNPRASEREALRAVGFCLEHQITFKYSADLFATYSSNMAVQPLAGVPVVEIKRTRLEGWGRVTKRFFDIFMSVIVLIIASPIMILCALAIFLETGRPIIYKNERVGKFGQKFFTFKFRSMYQNQSTGLGGKKAERLEKQLIKTNNTKDGPVYKIADDPRVTPFGRFIRRWSLDEFPQFFNVLVGEMSIVGPRPHQPREVDEYEQEHKRVFHIKPGITGLAQISGRSDLTFEEEAALDALYMEKWSLLLDAIIFVKTPFILFKKRKAL